MMMSKIKENDEHSTFKLCAPYNLERRRVDPDCSFRFENSADSLKIVNIKLYSLRTSVRRSRVLKVLK